MPEAAIRSLKHRLEAGERATFWKDDSPISLYRQNGVYYLKSSDLQPIPCKSLAEAMLTLLEILAEWKEVLP